MSSWAEYPYETRLNILHRHLELIDEKTISDSAPHKWFNQTLCRVNGSGVRVGTIEGEYRWLSMTAITSFLRCRRECSIGRERRNAR